MSTIMNDFDLSIWLDVEIKKIDRKIEKLDIDRDVLKNLQQIMWDKKN